VVLELQIEHQICKLQGKASGPTDHDLDEGEEATAPKPVKGRRKPAYAGGLVLEPKKGE